MDIKKIRSMRALERHFYIIDKNTCPAELKSQIEALSVIFDEYVKDCNIVKRGKKSKLLSAEQIERIKSDTDTIRNIATKYGVSPTTVWNIKNNKY